MPSTPPPAAAPPQPPPPPSLLPTYSLAGHRPDPAAILEALGLTPAPATTPAGGPRCPR